MYCSVISFHFSCQLKGTSAGAKDIVNARDITESLITTGTACVTGLALEDHTTYHSTLYITNGAVTSLTTTVQTDGGQIMLFIAGYHSVKNDIILLGPFGGYIPIIHDPSKRYNVCVYMLDTYMIYQTSRRLNKAKQINSTRPRKSFSEEK